jgi:hypothetical protein
MNEAVTIPPIYYFLMEFSRLVYASFPIIVIITGISFVIQSVHHEPWGNSVNVNMTVSGLFFILIGFLLMAVMR